MSKKDDERMTSQQFNKLPKYARQEIERLRRELATAERHLTDTPEGTTDTAVRLGWTDSAFDWWSAPDGSLVRLWIDRDKMAYIDVRVANKGTYAGYRHVEVHASDTVSITPMASNTFIMTVRAR